MLGNLGQVGWHTKVFFFLVDYQLLTKLICDLFSEMKFCSKPQMENAVLIWFPLFESHCIYQSFNLSLFYGTSDQHEINSVSVSVNLGANKNCSS